MDSDNNLNIVDNISSQADDALVKIIERMIVSVFILLTIILVIFLILKITGHSPTDVQILYVGFSVVISYLLMMSYKIGLFVGKVNEFMDTTKIGFKKLHEELKKRKR